MVPYLTNKKYSYSIPNQGSSLTVSLNTLVAYYLKFPLAGVFLSELYPSHKAIKFPFPLKGSLKRATGLIQISESLVLAYSVDEPS